MDVTPEHLESTPLTNEEIVALLAFICQAENIAPYSEHVRILRDKYDLTVDVRPLEVEVLSLREQFPMRILRNFYTGLNDQGFHSLIAQVLTYYQEDKSAALYAERLREVFVVQLDDQFITETLQAIENATMEGTGIDAIQRSYRNKLDQVAPYAAIPTWIKEFNIDPETLPHLEEKPVASDLPDDLLADYLLTRADDMGLVIEPEEGSNQKDVLLAMLDQLPKDQREELVSAFKVDQEEIKELQDNPNIFRVYGPVNEYADTDYSELTTLDGGPNVDVIYGGARMFTDMSQEYDYENDRPVIDWFRGYCLQCSRRIRSYHHAVRLPHLQGGWSGCYDTWQCVRDFMELDEDPDPARYNLYLLKVALTREFEEEL